MDNITHTIIGLGVAEIAMQWRMKDRSGLQSNLRPLYWLSSAVANNLPDLDVPWIKLLGGGRMEFLLQHRGYSHTLGAVLPIAIFTLLLCWAIAKKRQLEVNKKDWLWLGGLAIFGVLSHILADSWNSYGVHPFWPWQNRWYYGDFIFILEPWIWITLIPCLLFSSLPKWIRSFLFLLYVAIVGAAWKISYVPSPIALLLSIMALIGLATKSLPQSKRLSYSFSLLFVVLLGFAFVSTITKRELNSRFLAISPDNQHITLVISPLPANPFCWNYISVETSEKEFLLRSGIFAPFSDFYPVEACPIMIEGNRVAPLEGFGSGFPGELLSLGTFRGSLAELRLLDNNCYFAAFRHFARAPFWILHGDSVTIGDLRFDNGKSHGFSTIEIPAKSGPQCPQIPPWDLALPL